MLGKEEQELALACSSEGWVNYPWMDFWEGLRKGSDWLLSRLLVMIEMA